MINGPESLSGKYKSMLELDKLVHNIAGSSKNNASGLGTSETYVGLVEQNIGQDSYLAYFKLYWAYQGVHRAVQFYEKDVAKYNNISSQLNSIKNYIEEIEKDIKQLEEQRISLITRGNLTPDEEKIVESLTQQLLTKKDSLIKNTNTKRELENSYEEQRCFCAVQLKGVNAIQAVLEERISGIGQYEQAFNKFNDPSFEARIEQDFIDASLLPGEEAKEAELRGLAQSRFKMMQLETVYLKQIKPYAIDLLADVKHLRGAKQIMNVDLSPKTEAEYLHVEGMDYISTEFLSSSDWILDEKAISDFYGYVYNQMVKTELGMDPTIELANLEGVAMKQFKIPHGTLGGFKGQLSQWFNGYSTMFGIDCLTPVFSGARKMIEAKEQLKNLNSNISLDA